MEKDFEGDDEGAVDFGVELKEREGDVDFGVELLLGAEKDRLPELKLLDPPLKPFAITGVAKMPSAKTNVTTRARMRLTQVQGRIVPHPPG